MPRDGYPWWSQYAITNRLRRLIQRPEAILRPYVDEGMTCLEIGCGMGFFTVPMAQMVGPRGRVYASDVEPKLLEALTRRTERAGVAERVSALLCPAEALRLEEPADFALAVWSMHELTDLAQGLVCIRNSLRDGAAFLLIEPHFHVPLARFQQTLRDVEATGFEPLGPAAAGLSRGALFMKGL